MKKKETHYYIYFFGLLTKECKIIGEKRYFDFLGLETKKKLLIEFNNGRKN